MAPPVILLMGVLLFDTSDGLIRGSDISRRSAVLTTVSSIAAAPHVSVAKVTGPGPTAARAWTLERGVSMPTLALNTAGLSADDAERAFLLAVAKGITHVDFHPGIERDGVARALRTMPRSGVFLTTKIKKARPDATPAEAAAAAKTQIREDLGVLGSSVDMLLVRDHPSCEVMRAQWRVLEEAKASGAARAIGTVNFCEGALRCVLETAVTKPAVNYFMLHAGMGPDAHGLRTFGEARGVRTFAYGALGEPSADAKLVRSPALGRIGAAYGRSAEEVALRWVLQSGCAVSVRPTADFGLGDSKCSSDAQCSAPLAARAQAFDWALSPADMAELDALREPDGNPTLFSSEGCPGPSPLRAASAMS